MRRRIPPSTDRSFLWYLLPLQFAYSIKDELKRIHCRLTGQRKEGETYLQVVVLLPLCFSTAVISTFHFISTVVYMARKSTKREVQAHRPLQAGYTTSLLVDVRSLSFVLHWPFLSLFFCLCLTVAMQDINA